MSPVKNRRAFIKKLAEYLPSLSSNIVFQIDATLSSGYDGTSQIINDIQNTHDFVLGIGTGSDGSDPSFVGEPGHPDSYLLFDGGDIVQLEGGNPIVINNASKTGFGVEFTIVIALRTAAIFPESWQMVSTTTYSTNENGLVLNVLSSGNLRFGQRQGDVTSGNDVLEVLSNDTDYLILLSGAPDMDTLKVCINGSINTTGYLFTAGTNDPDGVFSLMGMSDNLKQAPSGTRLYGAAYFDKVLSDTEMTDVTHYYQQLHARNYK